MSTIFKNKKVLITGHTGFKGSWLSVWLTLLGAKVTGIALHPPTEPSHFEALNLKKIVNSIILDIRNREDLKNLVNQAKPDYIFHLAAQSLVSKSYNDPLATWDTNLIGTINLLNSLTDLEHKCNIVIITSDKCYENKEWIWGYREIDQMGGADPYSASKGASELAFSSFFRSFLKYKENISIASARAGNVIGGGDWALDRIIPDCVKKWVNKENVNLRNPNSTRPWQHVLEPLSGYIKLAETLDVNKKINGDSFNFGPDLSSSYSVLDLVNEMSKYWKDAKWNNVQDSDVKIEESKLLQLNCDKSKNILNWQPTLNFSDTVKFTAEWYLQYYKSSNEIMSITTDQINKYMELSKE
jgi:CDP-glucose 4,6-dehydratase